MLRDGVCIAMRKEEGMHEGTHPTVTILRNLHPQPAALVVPVSATQVFPEKRQVPVLLSPCCDSVKRSSSLPLLKDLSVTRLVPKLPAW